MQGMTGKHYAMLGGFLAAMSVTIASLPNWGEALKPLYVAGLMAQAGAFLTAMFSDKPEK